ncbi:MFS family permease [Bacillus pakistanensis]|uniref:MFS family permease n=1 Tax=Rossellomorea pakistanensis TaxID=992288 RepID=A0ABS2NE40_9BACI|nr:MFS transporter [Bacillus pakistanensis]MBM7586122.1 MFS family permease [Bacillus pakistanensis]
MNLLKQNMNFLMLFLGRLVTNIGDSIYYVASMWLVYDLGKSAFYTGLAGFLILLPKALQFLTGPFIDKWRIKRTLVITQLLQCILILIIPIAYLYDVLTIQIILIVMPIIAFIEEFAYPTQTKALPLILKKEELIKGNSLFAFAYQGVDIVFNASAGILVALVGAVTLYLVDSVTFAVAALFFGLLKISGESVVEQKEKTSVKSAVGNYFADLSEGFSIVFKSLLWAFLIGSFIANFGIGIAMAILPSFSASIGGVEMYGVLLTALSAGSLLGALLGSLVGKYRVGLLAIICFTIGSGCWTIAAMVASPILTPVLFGLAWVPIGAINVLFSGISQSIIPNHLLGRVNSVMYSMSIIAMPIGSLLGGYLATRISSQNLFAYTGAGILFIAIVWFLHPKLRKLPSAGNIGVESFNLSFKEEGIQRSKVVG